MQTRQLRRFAAILVVMLGSAPAIAGADVLEEIIVTADFRDRSASEIPASVTIFDARQVEELAVQHFEELVNVVPNLNWSGDGHRARYFQIRGVGELEQYQGAPNPSVGFLVDDIDFSGIGTIATLFDIERVEVLRGPQGSRYGANALGGLIYLSSAAPTSEFDGRLELNAGTDDLFSAGAAFGGPLNDSASIRYRVSAQHFQSNGFRDNPWLGREDSNGRDETTVRGRLLIESGEDLDIHIAGFFSDIDDGYDAFAIDNTYTMLSDNPGKDAQRSIGASVKAEWYGWQSGKLTSITAFADSDIEFDFDGDWGNADSWAPVTYDYVTENDRQRRTLSQEIRLEADPDASLAWLLGAYVQKLDEDLDTVNLGDYYDPFYDFADSLDDRLGSHYSALSGALFGQAEWPLGDATRLALGLRIERRSVEYDDSTGLTADPAETMFGGEASLTHDFSQSIGGYVSLARGFKAGGFNLGIVPDDRREFDQESMWNLETGVKSLWFDNALSVNVSLFYNWRLDQQVRTSYQVDPGDPLSYVFFTDNAAEGEAYGLEADARWMAGDNWQFYASIGLLDATFSDFVTAEVDQSGRDQAHSPHYTYAIGGEWRHPSGWFARLDASGKAAFYFDVNHDQESEPYDLVNARVGFEGSSWTTQLWVRNLFDERYAVRGFYFGNEPPDFPETLYVRLGDPRQYGVSIEWRF